MSPKHEEVLHVLPGQEIIELDVPNRNMNCYPTGVVTKTISEIDYPIFGQIGMPDSKKAQSNGITPDLSMRSHMVTNLRVADGKLLGDVHIYNTYRGRRLLAMIDNPMYDIVFRSAGLVSYERETRNLRRVGSFELCAVNALPKLMAA